VQQNIVYISSGRGQGLEESSLEESVLHVFACGSFASSLNAQHHTFQEIGNLHSVCKAGVPDGKEFPLGIFAFYQ